MLMPIPCPRDSDFICLGWGLSIRIFFFNKFSHTGRVEGLRHT